MFSLIAAEFKRFTTWLPRLALAFLAVIPLLYAALYLWSYWDPYGRVDKIPVAVVNEDQGVTVMDPAGQPEQVAAGEVFVEQLREDELFDWKFTNRQTAREGVEDGTYYFSIAVPVDFSSRLVSPLTGTPQQPAINVTTNDANGYIVGIMASTAETELHEHINAAVSTSYANYALGELTQVGDSLNNAATGARDIAAGASDAKTGADSLVTALTQLRNGATSLASGASQLSGVADGTLTSSQETVTSLNQLAATHPELTDDPSFQAALESAQGTVGGATTFSGQMGGIVSGAQNLEANLGSAVTSEQELAAGLDTLSQSASALSTGLTSTAVNIPSLDDEARANLAKAFGNPVQLTTKNLNPANVYGRGLAPFFFGIALWVFGLVCYSILRPVNVSALKGTGSPDATSDATVEASRSPSNPVAITLGAWIPALGVGLVGGVLLFLVTWWGLGLDPLHAWGTVGLVALAVAAFVALNQALRTWFGPIGLAISLVLLMLQLTSSGGLYPVETSPAFFQFLNKVLPMGYFVEALRVTISGGDGWHLTRGVFVLLGCVLLGLVATAAYVWTRRRKQRRDGEWHVWKLNPLIDL